MSDEVAPRPRKGRGAVGNPEGRFERLEVVPADEGWGSLDAEPSPLPTTVTPERTRRLITGNDSPDVPFEISINPYRGCEHGCVYCFARQTHAYLGLSAGLDFESRLFSKPDGPERLRRELARRRYRCRVIALGANTDPYQPVERRLGITRRILEVLAEHRHPVSVITKSSLVLRDLDLLRPMAADRLASVFVSVTTLDRKLARLMEPRAPSPERRLETVRALSREGVPTAVLTSPVIPGLNDAELESLLEAAADAGAKAAGYILIRLPHEVKDLFVEWVGAHYPGRAAKVIRLIREAHGGRLYDSTFGERMRGSGEYAAQIRRRYELACRRLGLLERQRDMDLDVTRFRIPVRAGDQLSLF